MSNYSLFEMDRSSARRPPLGRSQTSPPVSRLQLIQAQFQRKLLLEKEEKMMQLYPEDNNGSKRREKGGGGGGGGPGAVRQFFAQRRANNSSLDPLSSSGGIISLQSSMNGGFSTGSKNGPKHGSPIGWDKSYPLSPLDRDSSGSSSGYDSGNSFGSGFGTTPPQKNNNNKTTNGGQQPSVRRNFGTAPSPPVAAVTKPARRAPSLDRRPRNNVTLKTNGMRRSNSQILNNNNNNNNHRNRDEQDDDGFVPFSRTRKPPQNKPQVPKVAQPTRNSRSLNTKPTSNNTYKVETKPNRDVPFDSGTLNASPKGRKPIVPAIGYIPLSKSQQAPNNKKSPPVRSVARSSAVDPNLVECPNCGRRFAKDRIEKHEVICEKSNTKKRKTFDSTKMRMKETELESFVRNTGKGGRKAVEQPASVKKSDWRVKRNNFIESLRQAKVVQRHVAAGGKVSDLPPPPPMDTSDYISCPHCNRKFSEGVAERHIPKCQNIKSNKNGDVNRR